MKAVIRCGIGGWIFPAWRGGTFYPEGLAQREELGYAASALRCIEINGTFYRTPTAELCARWAAEAPDGFLFSMKAPRYLVQKRDLTGVAEAAQPFLRAALALGDRLGPLLWQFAPQHKADAAALVALMADLPRQLDGRRLQHAFNVRRAACHGDLLIAGAREHNIALVMENSADDPLHGDITADFVYARIKRSQARLSRGLPAPQLQHWAERAKLWRSGATTEDLPLSAPPAAKQPREVFLLCIGAAKARNPAAAMALQERCDAD